MSLAPGTRIGPYEVIAAIGRGGMGEVCRARDTTLDRDVAIKILPGAFVHDPDRLARFEREAKVLASLNHSNIATIYGLERAGGQTALVMELVDGVTLDEYILRAGGGLPVDQALSIARQIAEALDAAHEHGIIHRDLKPANIKVTEDGTVKVLDFGLAKFAPRPDGHSSEISRSPTMTSPAMTEMGVILGTAAYMSPEQARGKPVDKRTDIWAFGCVLFEMLAGRRPFDGEDVTEVLATVVKSDPAWALLPAHVPPHLVRLLRRCLEKDRRMRLRDIGDARLELGDHAGDTPAADSAPSRRTSWRERLAWMAAVVIVSGIAGGAAWRLRPMPSGAGPVTRFSFALPEGQQFGANSYRHVAVSPDGATIVYAANGQLYTRTLDNPQPSVISGTNESPFVPVFSPNGRSIAYSVLDPASAKAALKRIPVAGGSAVTLRTYGQENINLATGFGDVNLRWSGDRILSTNKSGVWATPETGGASQLLASVDAAAELASSPQLLDDGRQVLFTVRRIGEAGPDASSIVVQAIGSTTRKVLVKGGARGTVLASGHLVYDRGSNLMGAAFDARRVEVIGDPVVLAADVTTRWAVSNAGTLVYEPVAGASGPPALVWVDRSGREDPIATQSSPAFTNMRLSPDRTRIAFSSGADIWIWTFGRNTMSRLSLTPSTLEYNPAWMPDGRALVFDSAPPAQTERQILQRQADGSGSASVLTSAPGGWPNAVSPDGRFLVFHTVGPLPALMVQSLAPPGPPKLIVKSTAFSGEFSPDGRWLAYQSAESSRHEIYVQAFPSLDAGRWQVSSGGGGQPLWSPTGRELFFISEAGVLIAVPVELKSGFVSGKPVALFKTDQYTRSSIVRNYDVSLDGNKFLFAKGQVASQTITVVTNWFQEIEAKIKSTRGGSQ